MTQGKLCSQSVSQSVIRGWIRNKIRGAIKAKVWSQDGDTNKTVRGEIMYGQYDTNIGVNESTGR
jgi:hypothetical protein